MRYLLLCAAFAIALLAGPAGAVTFDDGMVHVFDAGNSFPFEGLSIDDAAGSLPTTVQVVLGGEEGPKQ